MSSLKLVPDRIIWRHFRFCAGLKKDVIAAQICFLPGGIIAGYRHNNEAAWIIEHGQLVLLNSVNQASCRFDNCEMVGGKLTLMGIFLLKENGPLYLFELPTASDRLTRLPTKITFDGEFGEEMNNFIPSIYWLHANGELAEKIIETYVGMEPFYYFLHFKQITFVAKPRDHVPPSKAPSYYLHANGLSATQTGM